MDTVQGRVVAVLKDVKANQDEGGTSTTITPVLSFTTHEGTAVTAHCTSNIPNPARAYGRDVTVHYPPADPAGFTLDHAAEHHSDERGLTLHILLTIALTATAIVGIAML
ncbi:hypothetical protein [Streptomyces sp. NBC_00690]|uniref:hypothetical protein n=1 Tax=Streptomyces sp. NBC_00690 TaxID=2975808 RepID=UPI003FA6BDC7